MIDLIKKHEKENNRIIPIVDNSLTDKFALDVLSVLGEFKISPQCNYSVIVITEGNGTLKDSGKIYEVSAGDKFFVEADTTVEFSSEIELTMCILKP